MNRLNAFIDSMSPIVDPTPRKDVKPLPLWVDVCGCVVIGAASIALLLLYAAALMVVGLWCHATERFNKRRAS